MTNYINHPEAFTYKLPDNMTTFEGALVEPAAVGVHAAMEADIKPGKKIIILGAGCIGLMTLQACKAMGAVDITVSDVIDKRLDFAKKLGASRVVNGKDKDALKDDQNSFDVVFETAGNPITAAQTTSLVIRGGRIMIVGTIPGDTPVNFLKINREVKIQTVFRYANNFPMTIEAISSGRFDVKSMVTDVYNYEDVQRAFEESISRKAEIIKSVIKVS